MFLSREAPGVVRPFSWTQAGHGARENCRETERLQGLAISAKCEIQPKRSRGVSQFARGVGDHQAAPFDVSRLLLLSGSC